MAGSVRGAFEEDPFFRDPFGAHLEHMRQVMRSFPEPFGPQPWQSLWNGPGRAAGLRSQQESSRRGGRATSYSLLPFGGFGRGDADFGDPFSAMDRMMSNMRNNFLEMQRTFGDLSLNPEGHTFSSSSLLTYSRVGDEAPKVFQASSQTRTAPGGIKETRKAVKDSESGLEKMAIGHHIQDRAHVIEKSKNFKTGDEEVNQEFINLDESEAQSFDEEWQNEVMKFRPSRTRSSLQTPKPKSVTFQESRSKREKPLGAAGSKVPQNSKESLSVKGTHVPLQSSRK